MRSVNNFGMLKLIAAKILFDTDKNDNTVPKFDEFAVPRPLQNSSVQMSCLLRSSETSIRENEMSAYGSSVSEARISH